MKSKEKQNIEKKLNHVIELGESIINMYQQNTCSERAALLLAMTVAVGQVSANLHAVASILRKDLLDPFKIDYLGYARKIEHLQKIWSEDMKNTPIFHLVQDDDLGSCPFVVLNDIAHQEDIDYNLSIKTVDKDFDLFFTRVGLMENAKVMCETIDKGLLLISKSLRDIIKDNHDIKTNTLQQDERFKWLEKQYVDMMWDDDLERFISEVKEYVEVSGSKSKRVFQLYLVRMDRTATDPHGIKALAELNDHFLAGNSAASFIVDNKDRLSEEDLSNHFKFVKCRKLMVDELEAYDLTGPPDEEYQGLFTNMAAQELALLLSHTINRYVDFHHNYQYAALQMAMMDLDLVKREGRNSKQMMNFFNQVYLKNANPIRDQTTLTVWISKLLFKKFGTIDSHNLHITLFTPQEFEKIKDYYWLCLSIINKVVRKNLSKSAFASYLWKEHQNTPNIVEYKNAKGECIMDRLFVLNSAFRGLCVFD